MELLKGRFRKPEIIQRSHNNHLLHLSSVFNDKNVARLRHLHDEIETHYCGLEAQGVNGSTTVVSVLMEKVPEIVRLSMIRSSNKNHLKWAVDDFLFALERELEIRESHIQLFKNIGFDRAEKPRPNREEDH